MSEPAISLASRDFRHAVALAEKAIERGNRVPILNMVRCRANGAFEAHASDLGVTVTAKVARGGAKDASFMLADPRSVTGAVSAAGGAAVSFDAGKEGVTLTSDGLRVEMKHQAQVDDFPNNIEVASETFSATFSHSQVRQLARITSAISTEETRYYLNGLYFEHIEGQTFRAIATDGHRMSMVDLVLSDATAPTHGVIIPRKTVRLLLDIAGKKPGPDDQGIGFRLGSGIRRNADEGLAPEKGGSVRAAFHLGNGPARVTIESKLIDGTYPDYKRVIPHKPASSFLFNGPELRRAVLAVSLGSERTRAVRIHIESEQRATISAYYLDTGIGTSVSVSCQNTYRGADIGYNGAYLLAMIDAAGGDEFLIRTTDQASPALIKNPADTSWTGILMPMRI